MEFKPIKTRKIASEIIDQIKELISSGQLHAGDRLLSERELSEKLKVSRASVREALSALEMSGLIEIRPGEGTFLRKSDSGELIEPLSLVLLMEKDSYDEILEVRKILEVSGARLAAQRKTEAELINMKKAIKQMEIDLANNELGDEADINFHYSIAMATHNSLLIRLMNTIGESIHQNLRQNREILFQTHTQRFLKEHNAIYQAIKAGDSQKAGDLMHDHLANVKKEMAEIQKDL